MLTFPTLRQMQYLAALAEHKNFGLAAEACSVTQSTLSSGIKEMEEILRAPLIDRTSRKSVKFTVLGEDVLRRAVQMLEQAEAMTGAARLRDKPLSWPLRMGIIPTIAPYLLPAILKNLQVALPDLDLHIHEVRSHPLVEKLQEGELDFGLMAFPYDTQDLHQTVIYEEDFLCAAPPDFFPGRKTVTLNDLENKKILLLEDGHCLRDHALSACRRRPFEEAKSFSATSLSTLIQLVGQGYGMTLIPRMAAETGNAVPRTVKLLPFSGATPTRKIGFAHRKGGAREKDIALVLKTITGLVRKLPIAA